MADKSPLKATYNGSDTNGLAEFASGDTVAIADGGTGATTASAARTALGVSPTAGSSSLTTLGTISTGVWEGTDVAIAHGGTGASTAGAALTALGASPTAGSSSITTLGTIATGTWEATDVAVAHGGTGASTASAARTNLGITDTTPGGSNTEIQYNNSGAFGASANLTFSEPSSDYGLAIGGGDPHTYSGAATIALVGSTSHANSDVVVAASGTSQLVFTDSADDTDQGKIQYGHSSNTMSFFTNESTRMTIGSDGAITQTVSATTAYDPNATRSPSLNLKNTGADTDNQYAGIFFEVGSGGSDGQASIDCVHNGTGFEADLAFATRHSSGNVQERMRLLSSGDITFANGCGWQYVQGFQATTTWTDTNVTMANKAQLIMWLSHNNFNGATEGRQWGMAYCSGNGEGSVNYFRSTINVIGSNSSGWHNYGAISLREKPDSGSTAGKILQVQRASNSSNGYFHLYKMSVAGSGL